MSGRDSIPRPYQHVLDRVARQYGLTLAVADRPHLTGVLDQAAKASRCASIEQCVHLLSSPGGGAAMAPLARRLVVGRSEVLIVEQLVEPDIHRLSPAMSAVDRPTR